MREAAPARVGEMSRPGLTFDGLRALTGQELGVSSWITVDQEKID